MTEENSSSRSRKSSEILLLEADEEEEVARVALMVTFSKLLEMLLDGPEDSEELERSVEMVRAPEAEREECIVSSSTTILRAAELVLTEEEEAFVLVETKSVENLEVVTVAVTFT